MKISRQLAVDSMGRKVKNAPKIMMNDDSSIKPNTPEYNEFIEQHPGLDRETRRIVLDVYNVPTDVPDDVLPLGDMKVIETRVVKYESEDPNDTYQDMAAVFKDASNAQDSHDVCLIIPSDENPYDPDDDDDECCESELHDTCPAPCEGCKDELCSTCPTRTTPDPKWDIPGACDDYVKREEQLAYEMKGSAHAIADAVTDRCLEELAAVKNEQDFEDAIRGTIHRIMDGAAFIAYAGNAPTRKQLYHLVNPDADLTTDSDLCIAVRS